MIKIKRNGEWVTLPPCDYNGGYQIQWYDMDADGSGRDKAGLMHRDRVATKRKLNLKWSYPKQHVVSEILELTAPMFFEVEYLDADGTVKRGTFYAGDKEMPVFSYALGETIYTSLAINLIER